MMAAFDIDVPYISQWDDTAKLSRGDCGIVCAAMVAQYQDEGVTMTPDQMIRAAKLPIGAHAYTFNQIIQAAATAGLELYASGGSTWSAIYTEIFKGYPVITLLRYGLISGNQDDFDGSHFWVVTGYDVDANEVIVNDPDWWKPKRENGRKRKIPLREFEDAIGEALRATGNQPYQSLFIVH